jgi:REP element-mobilizing transposase RayT
MELYVPYCVYPEISAKGNVWGSTYRHTGNRKDALRLQRSRNIRRECTCSHVHLCVKIPPKMSVAEFMGYLKGKSALMVFDKHPEYKQKQSGRHFWARGVLRYICFVKDISDFF